jgi:Txe/YoeB family toxin of Txe-Axe toxin-antitoxin module
MQESDNIKDKNNDKELKELKEIAKNILSYLEGVKSVNPSPKDSVRYCSETVDEIERLKDKFRGQFEKEIEKDKKVVYEYQEQLNNISEKFKNYFFWFKVIALVVGVWLLYQVIQFLTQPKSLPLC